jgi:branched-chain amino acid transport system permease protein
VHGRQVLALAIAVAMCAAPVVLGTYQLYLAQLMMINAIAAIGLNLLTGNCGQISLCHSSFMAIGAYANALGCLSRWRWRLAPCLPRFSAPLSAIRRGAYRGYIWPW